MTDLKNKLYALEAQLWQSQDNVPLLAEDFYEIGASGKVYVKTDVSPCDAIAPKLAVDNFQLSIITNDVARCSYKLTELNRVTLRTSIWRNHDGKWQMVFHQGTVIQEEGVNNE